MPIAVAPFDRWKYDDLVREAREKKPANYAVLYDYVVRKDHYRNGKEWVGPGTGTATGAINDQFAPEDATGEVLSNVGNAFSEPQIGGSPIEDLPEGQEMPQELQDRIKEAVTLVTTWWDTRRLQEHIQERQQVGAWAGFAGMRLWIPWRFLDETANGVEIREADTMEKALSYIHVSAPMPDKGMVLVDPATMDKCSVYFDKEVTYGPKGEKNVYERAEMVYLDPNRIEDEDADTIFRIVYADPQKPVIVGRLKLGGRMLFSEMQVRVLLTDPVIRTQRQLNFLTTLLTRIAETSAFRERYTKNAKPQGLRIPYEEGDPLANGAFLERDDEGRQWAVIPQPRTLGANTTTELVGLPQYDERGDQKGNQMPDVEIVDPVDPKPYIEAADASRRRILRMCGQGHLGGISNAEASGIAYEQARAVFEKDLKARRVSEEGMLRELLTTVLALAELITGKEGYYTDVVRITVDQHVDAGPRSPDLVRLDLEAYEAGVRSWESTASKIGVEDLDAERIRVRRSAAHILDILEKAVGLKEAFTPESIIEVLRKLDIPKEIIDELVVAVEPEPEVNNEGGDTGGTAVDEGS